MGAMKVYLVGGAVRDKLLGLPVKERDWVVVGSTPKEMVDQGYKPVGKDFPVFLHPKTHEEYALARTERKTAKGYTGFAFSTDSGITLEEDLRRRDLTINAIAQTKSGRLIDPFNGQKDLQRKILRHVSAAFAEDPVRILRIGRFAARFGNFKIAADTMSLMRLMVKAGEVDALVSERVWQELRRALEMQNPWRFFMTLKQCGALPILFPEIAANYNKAIANLKRSAKNSTDPLVRFAALVSSLTPTEIKSLRRHLKAPREYFYLAESVVNHKKQFVGAMKLKAEQMLILFEEMDAFRQAERLNAFLNACESLSKKKPSPQYIRMKRAYQKVAKISAKPLLASGFKGAEIKGELHKIRLQVLISAKA